MRTEPIVIYLDSSVVLAQLFAEDRSLPAAVTQASLISSRLLEYEVWNRIHARGLTHSHSDEVNAILGRISLIDFAPAVLARALKPFPISVRTLDALHLASALLTRGRYPALRFATHDDHLGDAAAAEGLAVVA